jgi:hypothetical protein
MIALGPFAKLAGAQQVRQKLGKIGAQLGESRFGAAVG